MPPVSRIRRFFGMALMAAGIALLIASACPYWLAIADYFDFALPGISACPDAFHMKALLICAVVIAVIGQRLFSGRDLRTGEKPKAEAD